MSSFFRFIPACAGNGTTRSAPQCTRSVHPRVCGERTPGARPRGAFGSSPRVRGTAWAAGKIAADYRFIPACAGNGDRPDRAVRHHPVHPRVCGERAHEIEIPARPYGSSPRVRGTALGALPHEALRRFIPACAGNGRSNSVRIARNSVHPRVCGERAFSLWERSRPRFIPACAGNGAVEAWLGDLQSVHPRVCGERPTVVMPSAFQSGSSPRVRGTAVAGRHGISVRRFIPACAGNGARAADAKGCRTVHPRVCGERAPAFDRALAFVGSSPRVRGTDAGIRHDARSRRFIPACAGNGPPC